MRYSIITINYNNKEGLEYTIKSVINQTSKDFEYIIIDGGSTDGSVDVIKPSCIIPDGIIPYTQHLISFFFYLKDSPFIIYLSYTPSAGRFYYAYYSILQQSSCGLMSGIADTLTHTCHSHYILSSIT